MIKNFKILILTAALVALSITFGAFKGQYKASPATKSGFAVVELFTSEGCSSCPPADELIAKVLKETVNKPVYILAYHVDYWNRLGWKDRFSSPQYSDRQRQYTKWLKLQSVYTPQIVVNGQTEFVGSQESNLRNAIQAGLEHDIKTQLTLPGINLTNKQLSLQYKNTSNVHNCQLVIAFEQKAAQTDVKHGENQGHILSHVNIVRQLNNIDLEQPSGKISLKLPQEYNTHDWEVIGFVQNTLTGRILSAQKIVTSGK